MSNVQKIRSLLEAKIGVTLREKDWKLMLEAGWVEQVQTGGKTLDWLADRFWSLREYTGQMPNAVKKARNRVPETSLIRKRTDVIASLCVRIAERDSEVVEFRRNILRGRLLRENEIQEWWQEREKAEPPPSESLCIIISMPNVSGVIENDSHGYLRLATSLTIPTQTPCTIVPTGARYTLDYFSIAENSVLDRL
jgi:hypothetical protein